MKKIKLTIVFLLAITSILIGGYLGHTSKVKREAKELAEKKNMTIITD